MFRHTYLGNPHVLPNAAMPSVTRVLLAFQAAGLCLQHSAGFTGTNVSAGDKISAGVGGTSDVFLLTLTLPNRRCDSQSRSDRILNGKFREKITFDLPRSKIKGQALIMKQPAMLCNLCILHVVFSFWIFWVLHCLVENPHSPTALLL